MSRLQDVRDQSLVYGYKAFYYFTGKHTLVTVFSRPGQQHFVQKIGETIDDTQALSGDK